jgi:RNA polymerase sigma-70 factor (ECF subfamily)
MTNYTDEELMNSVGNHDASAFEELFSRYERRIFSFFYRLVADVEEAKDCTQETFLRLWRGRSGYTPKGRFSTYIFQIAKNHFLNEHDKRTTQINLRPSTWENPQECIQEKIASDSSYHRAVANEIGLAISKAIAALPEIHRLVYILSEEQRLSYKEIAEVLSCPVGTVSSRKVEAVRKLRKLLEPLRDEVFGKDPRVNNSEVEK